MVPFQTSHFPLNSANFKNVFSFLFSFLQPGYMIQPGVKIEQEIPQLLKTLK